MDGVLIDAMPYHAKAFQIAFEEICHKKITKKDIFLLEGMPGSDLIREIFKNKFNQKIDEQTVKKISQRKSELFEKIEQSKPIDGVDSLFNSLRKCNKCLKAVVSGASSNEVKKLLDKVGLLHEFDFIITGEDSSDGKPHPEPFITALKKMNLDNEQALVVENSPLGVKSAIRAGIQYIVTLNNTPLSLADFSNGQNDEDKRSNIFFENTLSARSFILDWCNNHPNP